MTPDSAVGFSDLVMLKLDARVSVSPLPGTNSAGRGFIWRIVAADLVTISSIPPTYP